MGTDSPERPIDAKPIGEVNLEMHGPPHLHRHPPFLPSIIILLIVLGIMVGALLLILLDVFKVVS